MEKIFWVQHENLDEDSYLFINEERILNLETSAAETSFKKIIREPVEEEGGAKKFKKHSTLNEIRFFKDGYVISGNLISRDAKGRRMTYNCYIPKDQIENFQVYVKKIVEDMMGKEVHHSDLNRIVKILTKKKGVKDFSGLLIIIIILLITLIILNT